MAIRDRIRELRRVRAGDLQYNPRNWRTHPEEQRRVMEAILAEVGYADALLARELPGGALELLNGHLRAGLDPDQVVPVLIVDVDEGEAAKLLATLDPITMLAQADEARQLELLKQITAEEAELRRMIEETIAQLEESGEESPSPASQTETDDQPVPDQWKIVVTCDSEAQQKTLYDRFNAEGLSVRLLVI